jgi:hypothetical protein
MLITGRTLKRETKAKAETVEAKKTRMGAGISIRQRNLGTKQRHHGNEARNPTCSACNNQETSKRNKKSAKSLITGKQAKLEHRQQLGNLEKEREIQRRTSLSSEVANKEEGGASEGSRNLPRKQRNM